MKIFLGILGFTLMAVFGYFYGIYKTAKYIKKTNDEYRIPDKDILPSTFDGFKNMMEKSIEIGNIMDICFNYGFSEREKIEEDKIDKMVMELSAETMTKEETQNKAV